MLCPNGVTLDGKVKVEGETFTCLDLAIKAAQQESGSECTSILSYLEPFFCPTPAKNPCNLCINDSTIDIIVEVEGGASMTCSGMNTMVETFELGSETCTDFVDEYEYTCCEFYCTNTVGWVDAVGNGCDWYETNYLSGCPSSNATKDNCCYCGRFILEKALVPLVGVRLKMFQSRTPSWKAWHFLDLVSLLSFPSFGKCMPSGSCNEIHASNSLVQMIFKEPFIICVY
jgi:hypothetical protein